MSKKSPLLKKSNALIDAYYEPGNLWSMRLLLVAVSMIEDGQKITSDTEFSISVSGINDLVGQAMGKNIYPELERAARDLQSKTITITEYHDGRKRQGDRTELNVTSGCRYIESEGRVVLFLGPHIIPYLTDLKERYKSYRLDQVIGMKSGYGMRLFELCLRWEFPDGLREVDLDELKRLLGAEGKYSRFRNLVDRVLKPAIADINRHTDLSVSFTRRKAGRTIAAIQFQIARKVKRMPVMDQVAGKTKKKAKPDSRQLRIRELVLEAEGLDRLIGNGDDPSENERELMKQREELQRELDGMRQAGT
ncbi:replication initiation protein [Candidatus Saccharibacteria bacterium]|nr:replication initiation protein [Candidatus Saccharibacteria bacterium]